MKILTNLIPMAFLLTAFVATKAFCGDTTVIGTGYGATEKAATYSAIQNAAEASKGILLLSTSKTINSKLVSDDIVTSREGYAYNYTKISVIRIPSAGGMYKVMAKVSVSTDTKKILAAARIDSVSIETFLQTLQSKNTRRAESITFIYRWLEAHQSDYGYMITNVVESTKYEGAVDVTFKAIRNPTFKATLGRLIDRLNSFSANRYSIEFIDLATEGRKTYNQSVSEATFTYSTIPECPPSSCITLMVNGEKYELAARIHDKNFIKEW